MNEKTAVLTTLCIITLFSLPTTNGLCSSNCTACVLEYSPPFTVIYDASRARPDLSGKSFTMTSSDPSIISNSVSKYFIIQGGILKVNTNFSRNNMALNVFGNTILPVIYRFSVLSLPYTFFSISVCVQGLDDEVPTFPRSEVHISVLEGTLLSWPMDLAVDNDEGENSTQGYSILSNDPAVNSDLYLDIARNSYGMITSVLLNSTIPLEPGRKASYNFTVVAQEGRPNTTKGYQNVYLTVQYFCIQAPAFEMPLYQITLPLSTPLNTVVLTVKARHFNSPTTAPIYYSIANICETIQSTQCNSRPFALNSVSGNLILTETLDYNQAHQINIAIVGTDACNLVGSAQIRVQITVIPPSIQVILSNNGLIREDYSMASDVATVIINDPYHLSTNVTVLDNTTGLVSDTFYLMNLGSSYQLRLLHPLDSKVKGSYYITIQASDPANNVVYFTFNITVVGVNHPPVFRTKAAFIDIPYNTRNGTVVLHVHASDNDVGGSGVVIYQLPPPNVTFPYQNNFTVNATSGDILVNGVLDRTVAKNFLLLVMARDNPSDGEPYLRDYMVVNVTLLIMYISSSVVSLHLQPTVTNIEDSITTGIDIFPTQTMQLVSTSKHVVFDSSFTVQTLLSVYSTQASQPHSDTSFPVTIIAIAATLATVIILVICTTIVIVFCIQRKKGKVIVTSNHCNQLELQCANYEQSKADVQCNDILFISSGPDINGLQDSLKLGQANKADKVLSIQSTSDLASSISTDMIVDGGDTGPYSKTQLMAIYAANAQLLQNTGSQNSVHMFGSEGGIEVDEVDINNLSFDEDQDADSDDGIKYSVKNNRSFNDMTYQHKFNRTTVQPATKSVTNKQPHVESADTMDRTYNLTMQQHASQPMLAEHHNWKQQYCTHSLQDQEYHVDTAQHRYNMEGYRCGSASIASSSMYPGYQAIRDSSTPMCSNAIMVHNCNAPVSSYASSRPYPLSHFYTAGCPPSNVDLHTCARSATPHSLTPTDNSTLSSIRTNRAPEHYYSDFSLGSTNLSQPVP